MFYNKFGAALLVAALPLAGLVAAEAAHATAAPQASITIQASDKTPASDQAFTVSGAFTENNKAASNHVVEIQTLRGSTWQALAGAQERTNAQGRYQLKVVLDSKGQRTLRVVGIGTGSQRNAHHNLSVTVH
jgi:hypothetical protein